MADTELEVIDTNRVSWEMFEVPGSNSILPSKTLMIDPETGMLIVKVVYKAGYNTVSHWHNCSHGIYILDGILTTHAGEFGPGTFIWFPEGLTMEHGATENNDCTYLFITNRTFDIHFTHLEGGPIAAPPGEMRPGVEAATDLSILAVDTNRTPWEMYQEYSIGTLHPIKPCIVDPETGLLVVKLRYGAGENTPSHWHNCSHGIYVLDGILKTHAGEFGPGNFIWFPQGLIMEHGAAADGECTVLFIANKTFDIHFTQLEGGPPGGFPVSELG